MGLSLETFLDLTPFEFNEAHRLFIEKIEKDREAQFYMQMYTARLQLFRQLCPPKGKTLRITDLWELPGEATQLKKEREKKKSTKERFEKLNKLFS